MTVQVYRLGCEMPSFIRRLGFLISSSWNAAKAGLKAFFIASTECILRFFRLLCMYTCFVIYGIKLVCRNNLLLLQRQV